MSDPRTWSAFVRATLVGAGVLLAPGVSPGDGGGPEEPLLRFSTYLGGTSDDRIDAAVVGPDGSLWVAATVGSTNFPGTELSSTGYVKPGVVVLRINPTTHAVLSTVRLGGSARETVSALAVSPAGDVYVAGETSSRDFPVTHGKLRIYNLIDVHGSFVARLSPDGFGIAWTYVFAGENLDDHITAMCTTEDGDPVVVGTTRSRLFPVASALDSTFGGGSEAYGSPSDAFVARIRSDGDGFVFATYLGGSEEDEATGVGLAPGGGIVVSGTSWSPEVLSGSMQIGDRPTSPPYGGYFLAELDPSSAAIRRVGRLPNVATQNMHVAATADHLVISGMTSNIEGLPIEPPKTPFVLNGFVLRLDPATWKPLDGVVLRTWWEQQIYSVAVAGDGTVWTAGTSLHDADAPLPGAARPLPGGADDAYVAAFEPTHLAQTFGTYLGGNGQDYARTVAVGPDGSAWIAGQTKSTNFPAVHAVQPTSPSSGWYVPTSGFVARFRAGDPTMRPAGVAATTATTIDGRSVRVTWSPGDDAATSFAVDRTEIPDSGAFFGWTRVALVPGDAREWIDATVRSDRRYRYSVQAVNAAGGSPPSAPADAVVPPTLDVSIERGTIGYVWRRAEGYLRRLNVVRLRGRLGRRPSGAPDLAKDGLRLVVGDIDGDGEFLSVEPRSEAWRTRRGGRLRWQWRGSPCWIDFDPATGVFDMRIVKSAYYLHDGLTEYFDSHLFDGLPIRVIVGDDAGSTAPTWRAVQRRIDRRGRYATFAAHTK